MYVPRQCTQNTQGHIDYGIPLIAKTADYRTSYTRGHSFIPPVPQEFDCRVHTKINPELLTTDILIKNDVVSTSKRDFSIKFKENDVLANYPRATVNQEVQYIRTLQEALTKDISHSVPPKISEMKESYQGIPYRMNIREIIPPAISGICEISGIGRPIQRAIPPNEVGAWKYLDIYMTNNKLQFIPYNEEQIAQAKSDLPTFYNTSGVYKKSERKVPMSATGNKSIYDKMVFKYQFPIKNLRKAQARVPHSGMQSEHQGKYIYQTYSDMYPYTGESGQICHNFNSDAGPWQNLCPPGMYSTDYSHIGSGWPVRAVINAGEKRELRYCKQKC
ncbi:uncharacterized protein LOC126879433 [Diabrotica virgifera virgifera]|uniref:Uncharacterized protein n=1 Tax=Diabrotica virgifera virgifera TaxID=50390 RepID=A0ABM5JKE3_DIAVI|nr:uncharacterized protein LOC126879433 [Diabrotica virgifera virgifera]